MMLVWSTFLPSIIEYPNNDKIYSIPWLNTQTTTSLTPFHGWIPKQLQALLHSIVEDPNNYKLYSIPSLNLFHS